MFRRLEKTSTPGQGERPGVRPARKGGGPGNRVEDGIGTIFKRAPLQENEYQVDLWRLYGKRR